MKRIFLTIMFLITFCGSGICAIDPATGEIIEGYKGELPDVTARFQRTKPEISRPNFESIDAFNKQIGLKPIPRENPSYINVMLKKDKLSEYANDINELIPVVERIIETIETDGNEQMFAARVNYLFDNVEYLKKKYKDRPERFYESFDGLISIGTRAKAIVNIRNEAQLYSPYMAYGGSGYVYSPQYINEQLEYLLEDLHKQIILMKAVN